MIVYKDMQKFFTNLLVFGFLLASLSMLTYAALPAIVGGYNIYLVVGTLLSLMSLVYLNLNGLYFWLLYFVSVILVTLRSYYLNDNFHLDNGFLFLLSFQLILLGDRANKYRCSKLSDALFVFFIIVQIVSFVVFRVLFPEAEKVEFLNSNFIGYFTVLIALIAYRLKLVNLKISVLLFAISLVGAFFTSSRFALVFVLLVLLVSFLNLKSLRDFVIAFSFVFILSIVLLHFDDQFSHIFRRFTEESFLGGRAYQFINAYFIFTEHPELLVVPDFDGVWKTPEKGMSDNSLFEIIPFFGVLISLAWSFLFFNTIYKKMGLFEVFVIAAAFMSFNLVLWLPAVVATSYFANLSYVYRTSTN